jgi:hypothetical protein
MDDVDKATEFLREFGRTDLAALLKFSRYSFVEVEGFLT